MTAGVVGLVAAYVAVAVLLLSLNLRARWPWPVKAAAILVTAGFFVGSFVAVQAMLGWPTEQAPPAEFHLHAALIEEPDPRDGRGERGAIYLWLSRREEAGGRHDGAAAATPRPRVHALPYSRELHKAVADAQRRLEEGREVRGRRRPAGPRTDGPRPPHPDVELYAVEGHALPPKPGEQRPSG